MLHPLARKASTRPDDTCESLRVLNAAIRLVMDRSGTDRYGALKMLNDTGQRTGRGVLNAASAYIDCHSNCGPYPPTASTSSPDRPRRDD
jgi:hypothetical protein